MKRLNDIPVTKKIKVQQDSNKKIENERPKASGYIKKLKIILSTVKRFENNHKAETET